MAESYSEIDSGVARGWQVGGKCPGRQGLGAPKWGWKSL